MTNEPMAFSPDRLYGIGITDAELASVTSGEHQRLANVLAVVMDPRTDSDTLRYYLLVARNVLEADMRVIRSDIVGAQEADSSVPLGLKARLYDEQQRAYNSTIARASPSGDGDFSGPDRGLDGREFSYDQRGTLKEIDRIQQYIQVFESLAELLIGDNIQTTDLTVARITFLNTLAASRGLKAVVMAPVNDKRKPNHVPLQQEVGLDFFPVLNYLTEQYYMHNIDGEQYLRELFCFYHTGTSLADAIKLQGWAVDNTAVP